jgi:hypothetical protein
VPRRPRSRPPPDRGSRFRRLVRIAESRAPRPVRSRRRFPHDPPVLPPPDPSHARTPLEPRPRREDSLESLRLNPSDWRVLACHGYQLLRRHDPALADLLWHRAWEVDQGFCSRLSTKTLPNRVPAARPGVNAHTVRRAYDVLMYEFGWHRGRRRRHFPRHKPPLADLRFDADIAGRILDRLESVLEPADIPAWPWDAEKDPWPPLIRAVRQHSARAATLTILACVFKQSPTYLARLLERTPGRPLGL